MLHLFSIIIFFYWCCLLSRSSSSAVFFHWICLLSRQSSIKVIFHWVLLALRTSCFEVFLHWGCLPLRWSSIEVIFHWGCLPLRSSSTEVFFHWVSLPLILFGLICYWAALFQVSVLVRVGRGGLGKSRIKLNSVQLSWSSDWIWQYLSMSLFVWPFKYAIEWFIWFKSFTSEVLLNTAQSLLILDWLWNRQIVWETYKECVKNYILSEVDFTLHWTRLLQ